MWGGKFIRRAVTPEEDDSYTARITVFGAPDEGETIRRRHRSGSEEVWQRPEHRPDEGGGAMRGTANMRVSRPHKHECEGSISTQYTGEVRTPRGVPRNTVPAVPPAEERREMRLRQELEEITRRREFCYTLRNWLMNPTVFPRGFVRRSGRGRG
jgi:hypothetical protein